MARAIRCPPGPIGGGSGAWPERPALWLFSAPRGCSSVAQGGSSSPEMISPHPLPLLSEEYPSWIHFGQLPRPSPPAPTHQPNFLMVVAEGPQGPRTSVLEERVLLHEEVKPARGLSISRSPAGSTLRPGSVSLQHWPDRTEQETMVRGAVLLFLWLAGAEMLREEQVEQSGFCSWKCMKFVQMWPASFCVALGPRFDCVVPESANSWTIHGLWPSNVMNCCSCWHLFPSDLMDLPKQLAQHWPTFLNASSFKFWKEEWQKHGTCAGCMEALSSPSKYFGAALGLRTTYNIDGAFQRAGILPSCNHSYQLQTLQEALVPVLGKEHQLQCVTDGQARQVLVQLKVSLFSNFSAGCLEEGARDFSPYRPCENQRRIFYFPPNQKNPRDPCP